MMRFILAGVLGIVLLAPGWVAAEPETEFNEHRRTTIEHLAAMILQADFEPQQISVQGGSQKEALVKAAAEVREYLKGCHVSPMLCDCLAAVPIVTNGEYMLIKLWKDHTRVNVTTEGMVDLTLQLDRDQLVQYALYNMWPLQYRNFRINGNQKGDRISSCPQQNLSSTALNES